MNWLIYLDDLEIEEPIGFRDIEISIKRDEDSHGMTYEASTSSLGFFGAAYEYLKEKKESDGVKANVVFRALGTCDNYDYEEVITGRLNFGKFREQCGKICTCTLPVEEDSCQVVLNARREQKVDIDKGTGINGLSVLNYYAALGVVTELPAHEIFVAAEGYVAEEGDVIDLGVFAAIGPGFYAVRPTYSQQLNSSIETTQLDPTSNTGMGEAGDNDSAISPVVLLEESIDCFPGTFTYEVRLKGSFELIGTPPLYTGYIKTAVGYGEFYDGDFVLLHTEFILGPGTDNNVNPSASGTFDKTYTGTVSLPQGQGFYAYMQIGSRVYGNVTFDEETYVNITAIKSCPATNAELYYIHETLSRVTEAITNGCVRVKSSYYGRTDSEPFAFPVDGCGGLRALTSGLKIRLADEDKYFDSLKNIIEGLNAIDNIGHDVIPDPDLPDSFIMRVEAVDFFYNNTELLRHDGIPDGENEVIESKHYSLVRVGYKKWEVQRVNGLDEFNSNREYNTSIDTINSPLDITSTLVAGSYPIEITRQQSFADSGGADTTYDNETFIICMERSIYPYGVNQVELGNITSPENMFSPSTVYNFRISPIRNLMRWYKSIAAGFADISDASNQLFFTSGTGNLIAKGLMTDTNCRVENAVLQENQNIFVTLFTDSDDYTPLWRNELLSYEYPMSVADYKLIKANPYGYISTQCGNGVFLKHWIKEIKWRPTKGKATFILKRKYGV